MAALAQVIKNILDWVKQQLSGADESDAAWDPYLKEDENSLTLFQTTCNKELQNALFHLDDLKANQRIEGEDEKQIVGIIPKTKIEYHIYRDAAQIGPYYYLDRQAFKTPELLISSFVKMVKESTQVGEEYVDL